MPSSRQRDAAFREGIILRTSHLSLLISTSLAAAFAVPASAQDQSAANAVVSDPNEIVTVGDVVQVKVLEVDVPRKRISLTRKFDA